MRRRWRALTAGVELFAISVLGLFAGLVILASFVPGFGLGLVFLLPFPMLWGRRVTDLARRRGGVLIPRPYRPAPARPVSQPDGWFRRDRQLYRRPWFPALVDRLDWVLGDKASWRDLGWMLAGPFTGG